MNLKKKTKNMIGGSRPILISFSDLSNTKYKKILELLNPKVQNLLKTLADNKLLVTYVDDRTQSSSAGSYKDNLKKFAIMMEPYHPAKFPKRKEQSSELFHAHLIMDTRGNLKEIAIREDGVNKFAFDKKNNKGMRGTNWKKQIEIMLDRLKDKHLLGTKKIPKAHELMGIQNTPKKGSSSLTRRKLNLTNNTFPDLGSTKKKKSVKKKNSKKLNPGTKDFVPKSKKRASNNINRIISSIPKSKKLIKKQFSKGKLQSTLKSLQVDFSNNDKQTVLQQKLYEKMGL